jgi:hypothetical protein
VSVTIESQPPGADVVDEHGERLGVTPVSLTLPPSSIARQLWLRKAGYAPAEHTIVPDRARTLRAVLNPTGHRAEARIVDRRATLDPFR